MPSSPQHGGVMLAETGDLYIFNAMKPLTGGVYTNIGLLVLGPLTEHTTIEAVTATSPNTGTALALPGSMQRLAGTALEEERYQP